MKKLSATILTAAITLSSLGAFAADGAKISVNGASLDNAATLEVNGETMIPLRSVCEKLGFTVEWDGDARIVTVAKTPVYMTFSPDRDGYTFAKTAPQLLGRAPVLTEGTTYVPLSFIDEILQGSYTADGDIAITYGEAQPETEQTAAPAASVFIIDKGKDLILVNDFDRGTVVVNTDENTEIVDENGKKLDSVDALDVTKQLNVIYGDTMTASIPPETTAKKIEATNEICKTVIEGNITEIITENSEIVQLVIGANDTVLNVSADTAVYGENGAEIKMSELGKGDHIKALTSGISTMSIPPQMPTLKIRKTVDTGINE